MKLCQARPMSKHENQFSDIGSSVAEPVEVTIIGFSDNGRFDASTSSATTGSTTTATSNYNDFT